MVDRKYLYKHRTRAEWQFTLLTKLESTTQEQLDKAAQEIAWWQNAINMAEGKPNLLPPPPTRTTSEEA